jgi:hypothetical protein
MVTSTQIQSEPETYEPFLIHPDTGETIGVIEFCKVVVEVLGKEAGKHSFLSLPRMLLISKPFFLNRPCATDGHLASAQSEPEDCVPRRAQPRWPCRVCHVQSRKRSKRGSPDIIIPVSDESTVRFLWCGSLLTQYCECFVGPDTMIYWTGVATSYRRSRLRTAEDEEDI